MWGQWLWEKHTIKTLTGELEPMRGEIEIGSSIHTARFTQELGQIDLHQTIRPSLKWQNTCANWR